MQAVQPNPVPPPRSGQQRAAALDAARQRNGELKALRAGLRAGELTLEEFLDLAAQVDYAASRILVRTVLMALPGVRAARASQLLAAGGIDAGRRAGVLTSAQRDRLVAAVAELAARHDRRPAHPSRPSARVLITRAK